MTIKQEVQDWLKSEENPEESLKHLAQHGCVSGSVSPLIFFTDTVAFFERNKEEINQMLYETLSDTGLGLFEIFGEKLDQEDPLCLEQGNQNLLAWFGFEEVARQISEEAEANTARSRVPESNALTSLGGQDR